MTNFGKEYQTYCDDHGKPDRIELMLCDLNGILRGKWLPGDQVDKLVSGGVRLPISTYAPTIMGTEPPDTGLGIVVGDPDGAIVPVPGTLKPVPWATGNVAQLLVEMHEDGNLSPLSTRGLLKNTLERFKAKGLNPVLATELEFYVIKPRACATDAPIPPERLPDAQNYDLETMSRHEKMLSDIQAASVVQGLATDTLIAEFGPGQFEVNFHHTDDVLNAADTALLFRRLVRGVVAQLGYEATFMAKPFAREPGNGMHVHVSVLDDNGNNIFSTTKGTSTKLTAAVAGLLATMRDLQAVFAPHMNSYRRFQPNSFAPCRPDWGFDNRAAAIRLPETAGKGARLEHRISGADVNPYLVLTSILGAILHGLETKLNLPPSLEDPISIPADPLTHDWITAVDVFENSDFAKNLFGADYHKIYVAVRRDEIATLTVEISTTEYRYYLSRL
ncbi:MAG: glutamine synthetase family protein [Paracoccaceae bacterium]